MFEIGDKVKVNTGWREITGEIIEKVDDAPTGKMWLVRNIAGNFNATVERTWACESDMEKVS
jgi:nicotinamide riboside kinase